jgi:uncharacterized membrane protein HdeD (DUF308 family)
MEDMSTTVTAPSAAIERRQRPWWLTLILGIFAMIIGAVLLWAPAKTQVNAYLLLIQLLGIWWLVSGILDLVVLFIDRTAWGWKLFMGIISIIAGGYILMYPIATALVLPQIFVLLLGLWGVIHGGVLLFLAFRGGGWGAGIVGAIAILFGIILIANYSVPGMGLTMIWVAAVFGIIGGAVMIFQALFRDRKA